MKRVLILRQPLYREALELLEALGEGSGFGAATIKHNLALVYAALGSYERSASLLEESLERSIAFLGEDHSEIATSKDNLGYVYFAIGNYEQAAKLHIQALEIYQKTIGEEHPDVAGCLNNLALAYQKMGRYAEALPLYQRAMDIDRKFFGRNSSRYAAAVHNLGFLHLDLGDYANAESYLREALDLRRTGLGDLHPEVRSSLAALGELCAATSREAEGLRLLKQCAEIDEHLLGEAFSSFHESQKMDYLSTLQSYFNIFLSLVVESAAILDFAVRDGFTFVLRRKGLSIDAMEIPKEVFLSVDRPELFPQLQALIQLRAKFYRDKIVGPEMESRWDYNERLKRDSETIESLESELTREIGDIALAQRLQAVTIPAVAEALPTDSVLIEFVYLEVFDFSTVGAGEESKMRPPHYLAFLLPAGAPESVQLLDLGEAEPIDALVKTFRMSITGGDRILGPSAGQQQDVTLASAATDQPEGTGDISRRLVRESTDQHPDGNSGEQLRALIFDPLIATLGDCKRPILAPDHTLTLLPFEILPMGDEKYLVDEYQFSYVNTGREVLRFGKAPVGHFFQSLVVADPDYDLGAEEADNIDTPTGFSTRELPGIVYRLPGTFEEGKQIANLLDAQLLIGEAALSKTLKSCQSPLILHIATHAYFETEYYSLSNIDIHPSHVYLKDIRDLPFGRFHWFWRRTERSPLLRSCLLLAGFNTWLRGGNPPVEAEQGIVTAADVLNMDLRNTELVVLSACETGVGEVVTHEGVFGLHRAFLLAGARTLVTSLWKVPDRKTQELMSNFYENLLAGLSCADALRKAQIALKLKNPNAYYWGCIYLSR